MYFHAEASTLGPQSQLAEAGRPLRSGADSAIVQNGIGPRKLEASENHHEFCKTALRR